MRRDTTLLLRARTFVRRARIRSIFCHKSQSQGEERTKRDASDVSVCRRRQGRARMVKYESEVR